MVFHNVRFPDTGSRSLCMPYNKINGPNVSPGNEFAAYHGEKVIFAYNFLERVCYAARSNNVEYGEEK